MVVIVFLGFLLKEDMKTKIIKEPHKKMRKMKTINKILLGIALIGATIYGGCANNAEYRQKLKKEYPLIEGSPSGLSSTDYLYGKCTGFYLKNREGNIYCYTCTNSIDPTRIRSLIKSEIEDGDNEIVKVRGKSTKHGLDLIMLEANNEKLVLDQYLLDQIEDKD